jgi:hypothetical protein
MSGARATDRANPAPSPSNRTQPRITMTTAAGAKPGTRTAWICQAGPGPGTDGAAGADRGPRLVVTRTLCPHLVVARKSGGDNDIRRSVAPRRATARIPDAHGHDTVRSIP